MQPLVIYHAHCPDGFCAAWCAWKRFGDDADYVPAQYGEAPPPAGDLSARRVYVVDFSYKRQALADMAEACDRLTVLDHHKTARADLDGLTAPGLSITFDMDKSGGRLAWEHFFPGEDAPWLVDYTEDRDLWRWRLPHSKAVSAALHSHPFDFRLWHELAAFGRHPPEGFITEGQAILRYQARQVEAICANAREVEVGGHRVLAACTSVLFSEVAGELAEGRPFGAAWFVRADGRKQWSLRSREGGVDVSEVAKALGGGGHKGAAGFEE